MVALDYRDKIRSMAEQKPLQPTEVAKAMSVNSMLASAMLSEMSEKGLLKVSNLKVGSSPLYYDPARQEILLEYIKHLNEKDRKTVALLQEKGVLRDKAEDPLTRVSLRNTKDFAKPLDVVIDGNKEMFWKFYLLTDEQAADKIRQLLQPAPAPKAEAAPQPEAKPVKARKPRAKKAKIEPQATLTQPAAPVAAPAPVVAAPLTTPALPAAPQQAQSSVITDDPFLQQLMTFFTTNNITVLEQVVLKKKSEYDFVVQLASPVGQLHYYCKAKNKAKIGEADLSHAFVQGQLKKLPVLFLAPGILTKPAQDLLKELKGVTVKQV